MLVETLFSCDVSSGIASTCCKLRSCLRGTMKGRTNAGERRSPVTTEPAFGEHWITRLTVVLRVRPPGGHAGDVRFLGREEASPRDAAGRLREPSQLPRHRRFVW